MARVVIPHDIAITAQVAMDIEPDGSASNITLRFEGHVLRTVILEEDELDDLQEEALRVAFGTAVSP